MSNQNAQTATPSIQSSPCTISKPIIDGLLVVQHREGRKAADILLLLDEGAKKRLREAMGLNWSTFEIAPEALRALFNKGWADDDRWIWKGGVKTIQIKYAFEIISPDDVRVVTTVKKSGNDERFDGTLPKAALKEALRAFDAIEYAMRTFYIVYDGEPLLVDDKDTLLSDVTDAIDHADQVLVARAKAADQAAKAKDAQPPAESNEAPATASASSTAPAAATKATQPDKGGKPAKPPRDHKPSREARQGKGQQDGRVKGLQAGLERLVSVTAPSAPTPAPAPEGDAPAAPVAPETDPSAKDAQVPAPTAETESTAPVAEAGQVLPAAPEVLFSSSKDEEQPLDELAIPAS